MVEQSTMPAVPAAGPSQDASELVQNNSIGYGFVRPTFSYLNAMPPESSRQPSSAPVMQSESPRSLSSLQPTATGLSGSPAPFSYSVTHSSASFSTSQTFPTSMNTQTDGPQETGAIASAPSVTPSASQPGHTSSSVPATQMAPNSYNNTWMPPAVAYQVPAGMPRTPTTPGLPGISSSNMNIQQQVNLLYPSHQPAPGPWLMPRPTSGFARPPFSPYAAVPPGSYPMQVYGLPSPSVSMPDIQPPGVSLAAGVPPSSFSSGGQLTVSSVQADLPPGVENAENKDDASGREQLNAWTAHRTGTGTVYYYNAMTKESTYEKPFGFKGEPAKATVQPNPVSWEKLTGTDWTLVTTSDGKTYYYNSTTQLSSWQIPTEVAELRRQQEGDASKVQLPLVTDTNIVTEKVSAPVSLSTPAASTGGRDATPLRPSTASGPASALDLIKKKLQDSGISESTSAIPADASASELNGSKPNEAIIKDPQNESSKDKRKDANGDMSESSSDSEDDERGPTKEECILQFKEMLKERGVAPFSKWDKELPKILFDPRFKAIANHNDRRALFDHYVRTRAEEERKEKRAAHKAALEGFKQLLEEAKEDIDQTTDYHALKRKWGVDPRFQALDRKEKEGLLNERVLLLKRAAQERAHTERAATVSSFKALLQDKGDITPSSRWSKVKDSLKTDPRYKSVKYDDREIVFNEYIAELKAKEQEVDRKEKAKQDEEEKLKERERALRKRKEREEQEVERVRVKARRKASIELYQALLVETIKDPQASWTESKPKLEKDPQQRVSNSNLDKSDLEKFFREHVKYLQERCVSDFRALLNEVITPEAVSAAQETKEGKTVVNSWSTAKQLLKTDPRFNKMVREERESLWRRHIEEIQRRIKKEREKEAEAKNKTSVDSGKHGTASRRTHDRR